ncbi:MAG: GntR family transcriptional regulator [Streptosporangiaceae bacterium]|jgi:DNA-binding GntR family transcriptional regulator|nr:GntR family transcriptional regulator [Streptosporangiaceae bacterium]
MSSQQSSVGGGAPAGAMSPYDRIKKAIIDGTFQPGEVLTEAGLSELCGVSRTPVREALGRLEQDGLVTRTGRAVAVTVRTPEEILDIYETRVALEATAARMAAERHGVLDRVRLERLAAAAEGADRSDGEAMARANREFHRAVWQATHNLSLIDLLDRLHLHLLRYPVTTLTAPGRWERALAEHRALLAAVLDRDPVRAGEAAEEHFRAARDVRLAMWEEGLT